MRVLIRRLLDWLSDHHPKELRPRRAAPRVETLEDRTALSTTPGPAPTAIRDDYRLGGTLSESPAGAFKWGQTAPGAPVTITYSFSNLLDGRLGGGLPAPTLKAAIQEALGRWAAVAPLRFVEVADSGPAPSSTDYVATGRPMLRFGHLRIDGPYNVLAYGYYPGSTGLGGDVIFDDSEAWRVNASAGLDILEVATHEIGHALGMAHEPAASEGGTSAIMNPIYGGRFHGLGTSFLYPDDIAGIRALYGAGVGYVLPLGSGSGNPTPAPGPTTPTTQSFTVVGSTLTVNGTIGADTFRFVAGATPIIEVNGRAYAGSLSGITTISFDGQGGPDVMVIAGSSASETFTASAGTASLVSGALTMTAKNVTTITIAGGFGDTLNLKDTAGNDTFALSPTSAILTSGPYRTTAIGFPTLTASATAGIDLANLYDSAGDDVFTASPTQAVLSGLGYRLQVNGFDRVNAYGTTGNDTATLTDSAGNDALFSYPVASWLQGPGYLNYAANFDRVTATAGGGTDTATLYGSAGNDTFTARPTESRMQGTGYLNIAAGFDRVNGYAVAGGSDAALFYDSAGDDTFVSQTGIASLSGPGYVNVSYGFGLVSASGQAGGRDKAVIYDSAGDDTLGGSSATGYLVRPAAQVVYFTGLEAVTAVGVYGGTNRRAAGAVTFSLLYSGSWV